MKRAQTFDRITWAVDPFAEDVELQKRMSEALSALVGDSDTQIEPVSIIHWEDRYVVAGEPTSMDQIETAARDAISKLTGTIGLKRTLAPKIFIQNDTSLGNAVRQVIRHSKETGADLIVVGTQAKKGATRFLLGSFAEQLILQSDVPSLIVSPKTKPIQKITQVVFPTDLSEKSKGAFLSVVNLAKEIGASIDIFHHIECLPHLTNISSPSTTYSDDFKTSVSLREREAEALIAIARQGGVPATLIMKSEGAGTVEHIVEMSQAPSTMIAMVSQTNKIESLLIGSVTRQVVRRSICPVWVIHPKRNKH